MNNNMNKRVKYDMYKHLNGLLYRVPLHSPLHEHAEHYSNSLQRWLQSAHTVGGIVSSSRSTLVARNVVFKD